MKALPLGTLRPVRAQRQVNDILEAMDDDSSFDLRWEDAVAVPGTLDRLKMEVREPEKVSKLDPHLVARMQQLAANPTPTNLAELSELTAKAQVIAASPTREDLIDMCDVAGAEMLKGRDGLGLQLFHSLAFLRMLLLTGAGYILQRTGEGWNVYLGCGMDADPEQIEAAKWGKDAAEAFGYSSEFLVPDLA